MHIPTYRINNRSRGRWCDRSAESGGCKRSGFEKKRKRGSGEGYGWKDFNLPSGKMTIADARGGYEYIASPPAPSNSTIQA